MRLFRKISLLLVLIPVPLCAEWSVALEGGSVIRDNGNASRIRASASLDQRPLSHYLYADWIRSGSSSYQFGYKPTYWLSDSLYAFSEASMRLDKVLLIDRQSQLFGGLGLQLISNETRQVAIESGIGYKLTDYVDETLLEDAREAVGVIRGSASQELSGLFKILLDGDASKSDTYFQTLLEAGVSMRVPNGAIKLSHRIRRVDVDGFNTIDDSDSSIGFTVGF